MRLVTAASDDKTVQPSIPKHDCRGDARRRLSTAAIFPRRIRARRMQPPLRSPCPSSVSRESSGRGPMAYSIGRYSITAMASSSVAAGFGLGSIRPARRIRSGVPVPSVRSVRRVTEPYALQGGGIGQFCCVSRRSRNGIIQAVCRQNPPRRRWPSCRATSSSLHLHRLPCGHKKLDTTALYRRVAIKAIGEYKKEAAVI
jgi:hypothetical protein